MTGILTVPDRDPPGSTVMLLARGIPWLLGDPRRRPRGEAAVNLPRLTDTGKQRPVRGLDETAQARILWPHAKHREHQWIRVSQRPTSFPSPTSRSIRSGPSVRPLSWRAPGLT